MQEHGIKARGKRRFVVTTDSKYKLPIAASLLQRNFTAPAPNQVWTGDITCIATNEGWLYLAVFLDLFSRQVVGWYMQPHMQSLLVTDALELELELELGRFDGHLIVKSRSSRRCQDRTTPSRRIRRNFASK